MVYGLIWKDLRVGKPGFYDVYILVLLLKIPHFTSKNPVFIIFLFMLPSQQNGPSSPTSCFTTLCSPLRQRTRGGRGDWCRVWLPWLGLRGFSTLVFWVPCVGRTVHSCEGSRGPGEKHPLARIPGPLWLPAYRNGQHYVALLFSDRLLKHC